MMDGDTPGIHDAVRAGAEAYCRALHAADTDALARVFHPVAHLYASSDGTLVDWPLAQFLDRVGSRDALDGAPDFEIEDIAVAGPEMAAVTLTVAVPPRRFRDYLNFLKIDGEWRIVAKIFRVADGPAI